MVKRSQIQAAESSRLSKRRVDSADRRDEFFLSLRAKEEEHGQSDDRNGNCQNLPGNESRNRLSAVAIEDEGSPVTRMAEFRPRVQKLQLGQAQRLRFRLMLFEQVVIKVLHEF